MQYDPDVLRKLQLTELEMLRAIDEVCRENGITYHLDSGSALGAIRHRGFIPWDDDIDIGMIREEYDRFLAIAPSTLPDDLELITPGETPGYAPMFAKVMKKGTKFQSKETLESGLDLGVFVDIFPFDHLDPSPEAARKQIRICRFWQKVSYLYHSPSVTVPHTGAIGALERSVCRVAHHLVNHATTESSIYHHYIKAAESGGTRGRSCTCLSYPNPKIYDIDDLVPTRPVAFEDGEFPVPGNVEAFLTISYGPTWSELPPLEKRRNHRPEVLEF